jgi:hypothetical protein
MLFGCNILSHKFLATTLDVGCPVYIPATLPKKTKKCIYLSHRSSGYRLVTNRGPCTYCWEDKFKCPSEHANAIIYAFINFRPLAIFGKGRTEARLAPLTEDLFHIFNMLKHLCS